VLSIDEKTGIQAIERKHADREPQPGRARRREFEYIRHGTQALIAALDVHTGRVIGSCSDRRTQADLVAFMEQVALAHPKGRVHIVWDNLNTHRAQAVWDDLLALQQGHGVDAAASADLDVQAERYRALFTMAADVSHDAVETERRRLRELTEKPRRNPRPAPQPVPPPGVEGRPVGEVGGRDLLRVIAGRARRKLSRG